MTTTNPLTDIAFEAINDEYSYGKYSDFTVIMMKKNGYINATEMCNNITEQTGSKKPFRHWQQNKSADELIGVVSSSVGIPTDELMIIPKVPNELRGTYVHPDLIPHIASWASPKFAVKVSKIVNEYYNKKERLRHKRELGEKDDKIDELMKKLDKQHEESQIQLKKQHDESQAKINEQTEKIDKLLKKNHKISSKLSDVKEQNEELLGQNEELLEKVDSIAVDRVVRAPNKKDRHCFVIMKDESEDAERTKTYYAIRTKQQSVNAAIKRYQDSHDESKVLLRIQYNPNSINLWDRVKSQLRRNLRIRTNSFGLRNRYTEEELIADINEINDEKFDV